MSRYPGKVKGLTPKVESKNVKPSGKPMKKSKKKKKGSEERRIQRKMDSWEDRKSSKKLKKSSQKMERRERMRSDQSSKSFQKRKRKILSEYNDFFEFFNLPRVQDYSKLINYLEKKEVSVLLNDEERMKIVNTTNWKRNRNFKLLANVLSFEETHEIMKKKLNLSNYLVTNLFHFLDEAFERRGVDDDDEEVDYNDGICDLIRAIANLSLNESFVTELFNEQRLFEKLLVHQYFPFCVVSEVPFRVQIERAKILSNLSIEPKVYTLLKKKSEKLIERLIDLTRQKGMIGEFMQIFWTWVVFHEDDANDNAKKKGKKDDDDEEEEEENEGEEEEEEVKDYTCAGPVFKSPFIDNFIPLDNQELIKEKILSVCQVLEEYSENLIRVEIPSSLLVSDTDLTFRHSPRRTGVVMFRSLYRGNRGLGGGGGKCHKPVIYLYPPEPDLPIPNVSVGLDFQGGAGLPSSGLTVTIPHISNWKSLQVSEGSKIRDLSTGKVYNYLFWEGDMNLENHHKISEKKNMDFRSLVSKDDVPGFLRDVIEKRYGLLGSEIEDFMEYWCPVFKYLPFKCFEIGFLGDEKWSEYAQLDITPTPDLMIRLFMVFRGVEDNSKKKKCRDFSSVGMNGFPRRSCDDCLVRKGKFVVVEWGGMQL